MYVTAQELAQRLRMTVKTVYDLANTGGLPKGARIGKSRRWDWEKVEKFIYDKSEVDNEQKIHTAN